MVESTHRQNACDPERVIVLGARGFVGSAVVRHLESLGWLVRGVASAELDLTGETASVLADLLREEDTVVLVSALTPDRGRDALTLERNIRMVRTVAQALEQVAVAQLVNIGSDAVYADDIELIRETSCTAPSSLHGVMHLAREVVLTDICERRSVPLSLLRPSLLYGPGDTHNGYGPNRFVRSARARQRIDLFGEGEERRDHVFVDDVARVVAAVIAAASTGVLDVATGTSHSFREVAETVTRLVPGEVEIESSARANPIVHRHFDVAQMQATFPTFVWTSLGDGLARMIEEDGDLHRGA